MELTNLKRESLGGKIVLLIGLLLLGFILSLLLTVIYMLAVGGISGLLQFAATQSLSLNNLLAIQTFSVLGFLVFPAIVFTKVQENQLSNSFVTSSNFLFSIGIILVALPIVGWLGKWNEGMQLPQLLSELEYWMKEKEESAKMLIDRLTSVTSISGYILNVLVIAIIAALSEELLFRGVLQKTLNQHLNIHIAIWVTAFVFSAFHLQFYGFVPRFLLGAILGYIYYWSGNLWLPILAHFTNNFIAVTYAYYVAIGKIDANAEDMLIQQMSFPIASVLFTGTLLFYMRKQSKEAL